MKVQVLSDIHLEIDVDPSFSREPSEEKKAEILLNLTDPLRLPPFAQKAPYLFLLGDIGYPHSWVTKHFLLEQAERYEKVFVVAGNHEFYSTTKFKPSKVEVLEEFKNIKHPNLVFLDRSSYDLGGFRIIGCTLWSEFTYNSNDYTKIYPNGGDSKQLLTEDTAGEWFVEETEFIKKEIQITKELHKRAIIITHHAPSKELMDFAKKYSSVVPVWAYGHTHYSSWITRSDTLYGSNQVGYLQLGYKDKGFFPECVVEIKEEGPGKVILKGNEYKEKKEKEAKESAAAPRKAAPPPPPPPKK